MFAFFKFVFGPIQILTPAWRKFKYREGGEHWCPRRLVWTFNARPPELELYPGIWWRRARRWFQGKRDHQIP